MSIEITTATAAELVGIRGALELVADGSPSFVRDVFTQAQFIAANAETGAITIRLCADITLPVGTTTIAAGKTVEFNAFKFVSPGGAAIFFYGLCAAERRQIFSGFSAGSIRGTFGRESVYPEWWGLEEGRHDIAINAAIQANGLFFSNTGLVVSLAAGVYDVARPLDLAGTASALVGAGSNRTYIRATTAWTADTWKQAEIWGNPALDVPNHAALIWMGADTASAYSYRTQVIGMEIECYQAAYAHRATKYVSGISSKGGVEENSRIHDVSITNASGFGIGFCRHKHTDEEYYAATVNGLELSNWWITGPTKRASIPLYSSPWTVNWLVSVGTIDVGLVKSASAGWSDSPADAEPEWVRDYPQFGVYAAGNITLQRVHIEGPVIGIVVPRTSGESNVCISGITGLSLMNRNAGQVYRFDDYATCVPPIVSATADHYGDDYYGESCLVLIAGPEETGSWGDQNNYKDSVTVSNLNVIGNCTWLVRDDVFGQHVPAFGRGQFPNTNVGKLTSYERGNVYFNGVPIDPRPASPPYYAEPAGSYDKATPSTDRVYFSRPVY